MIWSSGPSPQIGRGRSWPSSPSNGGIRHVLLDVLGDEQARATREAALSLALEEAAAGMEVAFIVLRAGPKPKSDVCELPTRFLPATLDHRTGRDCALDAAILATLAVEPPNTLFHLHGGGILGFLQLGRQFRRLAMSYVVTTHGAYADAPRPRGQTEAVPASPARQLALKAFLEGARVVLVSSPLEQDVVRAIAAGSSSLILSSTPPYSELVFP
jgi:hypothetical protein